MDTPLTFTDLRTIAGAAGENRERRAVIVLRAWWNAFYFHALPHPLSEVLYWDLLYVGLRGVELVQRLAGRARSNAEGMKRHDAS